MSKAKAHTELLLMEEQFRQVCLWFDLLSWLQFTAFGCKVSSKYTKSFWQFMLTRVDVMPVLPSGGLVTVEFPTMKPLKCQCARKQHGENSKYLWKWNFKHSLNFPLSRTLTFTYSANVMRDNSSGFYICFDENASCAMQSCAFIIQCKTGANLRS